MKAGKQFLVCANFKLIASYVFALFDGNLYVCGETFKVMIIGNLLFQLPFTLIEVNICHNEQCLRQHARVAAKPALYPSSQLQENQFTVENASQNTIQGPQQPAAVVRPVSMANRRGREEETTGKPKKKKNIAVSSKSSRTHHKQEIAYVEFQNV